VSFPFARQMIAVRRQVTGQKNKPDTDHTRHYVTSIGEGGLSPGRQLEQARGYWSVENRNHWKRDAVWHEDRARMRAPNIGRMLALLRSALLAVVARSGYRSLPEALESMGRDPSAAIALIQRQRLT
jgi:predicted transposase YbfD/YdcC